MQISFQTLNPLVKPFANDHLFRRAENLECLRIQLLTFGFILIFLTGFAFFVQMLITGYAYNQVVIFSSFIIAFSGLLLIIKNHDHYARILLSTFIFSSFTYLRICECMSSEHFIMTLCLYSIASIFINRKTKFAIIDCLLAGGLIAITMRMNGYFWLDMFFTLSSFYIFFYLCVELLNLMEKKLKLEIQRSNELNLSLEKKNQDIQIMMNIMAHDFKAPLRSIKGFTQLIELKLKKLEINESNIYHHFSYVNSSVCGLENLVSDLLIQSKIELETPVKEIINVQELIENQLLKVKFQLEQSKTIVKFENTTTLFADRKDMHILFMNLISNAIKYQPKDVDHIPIITISQSNTEHNSNIHIEDNGIGLDEKYHKELFLPFKRLHSSSEYQGTGLGLSICKSIMDKYDGSIVIKSKVGKGARFTISLPVE